MSREPLDPAFVRKILGPGSSVILLGSDYNRKVRELSQSIPLELTTNEMTVPKLTAE